jgi:hypothetical protein
LPPAHIEPNDRDRREAVNPIAPEFSKLGSVAADEDAWR